MLRQELHVVLHDGTRVLVRPVRPDDRDRLRRGLELLSPRSRYLRFHGSVDELTEEQVDHLTSVDQRDHAAWAALDEDRPDHPGIGVARYVRIPGDPTVAEAAVTVVDEYQGRGLGTVLLGVLGRTARDNGIRCFRTYVLAGNDAVRGLLDDLGVATTTEIEEVRRVDVPIPDDPADLPDTPAGRVLRSVAAGRTRMLASALLPVRISEDLAPRSDDADEAGSVDLRSWIGAADGPGSDDDPEDV